MKKELGREGQCRYRSARCEELYTRTNLPAHVRKAVPRCTFSCRISDIYRLSELPADFPILLLCIPNKERDVYYI